jgi:hypothetical protein
MAMALCRVALCSMSWRHSHQKPAFYLNTIFLVLQEINKSFLTTLFLSFNPCQIAVPYKLVCFVENDTFILIYETAFSHRVLCL